MAPASSVVVQAGEPDWRRSGPSALLEGTSGFQAEAAEMKGKQPEYLQKLLTLQSGYVASTPGQRVGVGWI